MKRNTPLTQQEIDNLRSLYIEGKSTTQIHKELGCGYHTLNKYLKGVIRSKEEQIKNSRKNGRFNCSEETRNKLSENAKRNIKKSKKIWTKPEREFKTILNEIGVGVKFSDDVKEALKLNDDKNATIMFQYPLQRYVCDFVDLDNKIVFQVNGDFWHANPILYCESELSPIQKHNIRHDKNRKAYLESLGYSVINIWESEIYWNKELVKDKIRATRRQVNPSVLHADVAGSESQVAHDWSERVKNLWFKKPRVKHPKISKKCPSCNTEFNVPYGDRDRKFCSNKCKGFLARKTERPSRETVMREVEETSYCAVARKYGVSDNAVRKWLRNDKGI